MGTRVVEVDGGILRIEQSTRVARHEVGMDVSGPACVYAQVHVGRGSVAYYHGSARIAAPRSFAVFLPPYTLVQASLDACTVKSVGLAFLPPAGRGLPRTPVLLHVGTLAAPRSREEVFQRLSAAAGWVDIGRSREPAHVAGRAKAIIDAGYPSPLAIGGIARRLGVAPAVLSRAFRRTFGMPPVRYRHQVRIMDALMRLAAGAVPIDVFQDVGFDDLSRFYKVFRSVACAPPGGYRPPRSRNAKT